MENRFLYFISDYFLVLGIFISYLSFFIKDKSPKYNFTILITMLGLAVLGYYPYLGGALKLAGAPEILQNFLSVTPFADFNEMFLNSSVAINPLAVLFKFIITLCGFGAACVSYSFIKKLNQKVANFSVLFLIAVLAGNLLGISNDFISVLISLEIMCVCVCFMTALFNNSKDKTALETCVKCAISSGFALCFAVFGLGIIYLHTGTLNFTDINLLLINGKMVSTPVLEVGEVLFVLALLSKIGAFPFHMWHLDILKGTNLPTALFATSALSCAAVCALVKVLSCVGYFGSVLNFALILCAVLTVLISALMLYRIVKKEADIKSFLALNSSLNLGFVFFGISFLTKGSISAGVFCLIVYLIGNFGLFASLMLLIQNTKKEILKKGNLDALKGLSYISPFFGAMLSLCLLSFAGLPFMAGFSAKFYMFTEVLRSGIWAVYPLIFVLLAGLLAVYCALKLILLMYSKPALQKGSSIYKRVSLFDKLNPCTAMLSVCAVLLFVGFFLGDFIMNILDKLI